MRPRLHADNGPRRGCCSRRIPWRAAWLLCGWTILGAKAEWWNLEHEDGGRVAPSAAGATFRPTTPSCTPCSICRRLRRCLGQTWLRAATRPTGVAAPVAGHEAHARELPRLVRRDRTGSWSSPRTIRTSATASSAKRTASATSRRTRRTPTSWRQHRRLRADALTPTASALAHHGRSSQGHAVAARRAPKRLDHPSP